MLLTKVKRCATNDMQNWEGLKQIQSCQDIVAIAGSHAIAVEDSATSGLKYRMFRCYWSVRLQAQDSITPDV